MVVRASDTGAKNPRRPRGWTMHSIPLAEDDVTPTLADPALDLSVRPPRQPRRGRPPRARRAVFPRLEQGSVYLGRDTHSNRPVEVKILASEAATTAAVDRFRERSRRMLGLSHPGIAAVLGEGITENGLPFVVMEHRAGRNLHHLQGDPRLAWPAPAAVVRQLAEALAALHALGVVHGAVTPGNVVWIEDAGTSPRVQLVDREFDLPPTHEFAAFEARGSFGPQSDTRSTPGDAPPGDDLHALGKPSSTSCAPVGPPPSVASPASAACTATTPRSPSRSASRPSSSLSSTPTSRPVRPAPSPSSTSSTAPPAACPPATSTSSPRSARTSRPASAPPTRPASPPRTRPAAPPPPRPASSSRRRAARPYLGLDSSSAAQALAAAMDAFDSDEPPETAARPDPRAPPGQPERLRQAAPFRRRPRSRRSQPSLRNQPSPNQPSPNQPSPDTIADDRSRSQPPARFPTATPRSPAPDASVPSSPPATRPQLRAQPPPRRRLRQSTRACHTGHPERRRRPSRPPPRAPTRSGPPTLAARVEASHGDLASPATAPASCVVVIAVGLLLILIAWLLRAGGEPLPRRSPSRACASISEARDRPRPRTQPRGLRGAPPREPRRPRALLAPRARRPVRRLAAAARRRAAAPRGGSRRHASTSASAASTATCRPRTATRRRSIWEGEPEGPHGQPETRTLTYFELHREVVRFAGRPRGPRRRPRRPRDHLHGHGARGHRRHAGLRPPRRRPLRRLRRLRGRGPAQPHRRLPGAASSSPRTAPGAAATSWP
jgi:serine/threonine protein kinase